MQKILLFGISMIAGGAFAQNEFISWESYFGGTESDGTEKVLPIDNDTYYLIGWTTSQSAPILDNHSPMSDILVVKYSRTSGIIWKKCIGSPGYDFSTDAMITSDGGLIILGDILQAGGDISSIHSTGEQDTWMVKMDQGGNIQWEKSYGGTQAEYSRQVIQAADGGYIFISAANSSDGDITGTHTGDNNLWLVKTDATGNILWDKALEGDFWGRMLLKSDGSVILAMASVSQGNHGMSDISLLSLDNTGNLLWEKNYGGSRDEFPTDIVEIEDGYLLSGFSFSNDGDISGHHGQENNHDGVILKVNKAGDLQWSESYGSEGYDIINRLVPSPLGGYFASGQTGFNAWVIKTGNGGEVLWEKIFEGDAFEMNDIAQLSNGDMILFSVINKGTDSNINYDWRISVISQGVPASEGTPAISNIYPVPFSNVLTVSMNKPGDYEMKLYDVSGKSLLSKSFLAQQKLEIENVSMLPAGAYVVEVKGSDAIVYKAVIKL